MYDLKSDSAVDVDKDSRLKVGVIGTGYFGKHHARVLSEIKNANLVAVSDINLSSAEEIGSRLNVKVYENFRELLKQVEAVVIATPTATHYNIAMECMNEGVHLFVEKPIASTVDEADVMIRMSQSKDLVLQVGHIERFNPGFKSIGKCLVNEMPLYIAAERVSPLIERALNVDVTLDLMIHDIDIAYAVAKSEVKSVYVTEESVVSGRIDTVSAWLEFENGMRALLIADRMSKEKRRTFKAVGRNNFLKLDYITQELLCYDYNGNMETINITSDVEPLKEELSSFVDCVISDGHPVVSGYDGRRALDIALRISNALREHAAVAAAQK
ncbi:MAG: Gfo/Idh/MocA family oxidoreductase [Nitrospirae bacterium]|nr:Gfo/Idh/MocA family oxidoreductase [Nitrospirota bacterium]MBF0533614.1 Gfo/Idh/MocA family oxidoreductase [Nitrospirota bacterium]MBF0616735.1 Gfo/Idh/MocA family oxidoreductase [Nitrospirota bacterium]